MRPNTFIVGAAKCGTTALANTLALSPDVSLPKIKEPHYHIPNKTKGTIHYAARDFSDYEQLYQTLDTPIRLDASVLYLPFFEYSAKSIQETCGSEVKVIMLLRDPLERAISAYKQCLRYDATENLGFSEAVLADSNRRSGNPMLCYAWLSNYAEQVKYFQQAFDQVMVIRSWDLAADRQGTVDRIADYLDIPRFGATDPVESNVGNFAWKGPALGRVLNTVMPPNVRSILRRKLPAFYIPLRDAAVTVFGKREGPKIEIEPQIRDLFAGMRADIENHLGYSLTD